MERIEMNCLAFRRLSGGDPGNRDKAFLEHRLACRNCAAFADEVLRMDSQLRQAMAVDLPEGLVERIVADVSMRAAHRTRWIALAASLVVGFAAVIGLVRVDSGTVLASEVVEHMYHEPDLLLPTDTVVGQARLIAVVERGGAELTGTMGDVSYAGLCYFRGRLVAHLTVRGEHGPITVLLLPDESVAAATPIDEEGFQGTILPAGEGSIAIIGGEQEPMEAVERRITERVRWQI
jgi:uncharacterized protein DUF3379